MRLSIFSKYWLLQFQKSINNDLCPLTIQSLPRKISLSAETFTWAIGPLFALVCLFFSVKGSFSYFSFQLKFSSKKYFYNLPLSFHDKNYYFCNKILFWSPIYWYFLSSLDSNISFKNYLHSRGLLGLYFSNCTSYKLIDLVCTATIGGLPAFEVFWNCNMLFTRSNLPQHSRAKKPTSIGFANRTNNIKLIDLFLV